MALNLIWQYASAPATFRDLDATVGKYEIRHHSKEIQDALYQLLVHVNWLVNDPEIACESYVITTIPSEIRQRIKHFSPEAQKKMMVSSWIQAYDTTDFSLLVEKFYETSEFGCNDDVWRVTANDYSVVFVSTRTCGNNREKTFLNVAYRDITVGMSEYGFTKLINRYFTSATLFAVTGNTDSFLGDAMQWKLSR